MKGWNRSAPAGLILILLAILAILIPACTTARSQSAKPGNGPEPHRLTVFAAASLVEAFTELGKRFEGRHPGIDLAFNFAGSQQLAQQLAQGASADLFASANLEQMEAVIEQGRVSPGSQLVFVRNRLVVVVYPGASHEIRQLPDLVKPGLIIVLAGETVPAGKYALQFIAKAGQDPAFGPTFEQVVLKNVASYEENVRAVLSKVILGEADAGIVYASDAAGVPAGQIQVLYIPEGLNVQASYYIAPVSDSSESGLAQEFIRFLLSSEGQQVLSEMGFQQVEQP